MKLSTRYTSAQRFYKEVLLVSETPLMRTFKSLHERISVYTDLDGLDPMEYFGPFLDLVKNPETPADLTLVALSSIDKFILYGLVTKESDSAAKVINSIADALCRCEFESTYSTTEESLNQYLLDMILNCLRCEAGILLTTKRVWSLFCYVKNLAFYRNVTPVLQKSASNTLTHMTLTVFSRLHHIDDFDCVLHVERTDMKSVRSIHSMKEEKVTPNEEKEEEEESNDNDEVSETVEDLIPYNMDCLYQVLSYFISITNPTNKCVEGLKYGLSIINILLEMNGDILASFPCLVELIQGSFCKYLIQNSQSDDPSVLSLTLRIIFNLFQSLKSYLKVQLEVFFTSVHIRLADTIGTIPHDFVPKEASLESLLDFCQEPTVMIDLYTNYDCDTQCTNLYERLCECLYANSLPGENKPLTSMNTLAFQGLLAILHSIAQRCITKSSSTMENNTHNNVLKRRHRKKVLHEFAQLFNKEYKKEGWIDYAIKEKLVSSKEDVRGLAELLKESAEIDKTVLGESLAWDVNRNPFFAKLRYFFIRTFSFNDMPIDEILRTFLGTFRIPGEAQAIDRIVEDLADYVYETNPGPFQSKDVIHSLFFSCLLLNTDQHNPGVKNRMTLEGFIKNNRGINNDSDLPMDMLEYLYDSIKSREIKLLSDTSESLDLSYWEQDITYRVNKVSEAAFSGAIEGNSIAGDGEKEMFMILEPKMVETIKMIVKTSEDELLLQKTVAGIKDFLHISHFFDLHSSFASMITYLTQTIPILVLEKNLIRTSPNGGSTPPSFDSEKDSIQVWKSVNLLRLLLKEMQEYCVYIESEWKDYISFLFWLCNYNLLPDSPTIVDIAAPDNTLFLSCRQLEKTKPVEDKGFWNAFSVLFANEEEKKIDDSLVAVIQDVIMECSVEEVFSKSNRIKVNSWVTLFKSLVSQEHTSLSSTTASMNYMSLYITKLHWVVLLLSRNTDRIGMVWGQVISFLERVRYIAMEMKYKYVLERFIVEIINLTNILLTKPQLSEQGFALLALLQPIPAHRCLSSRRVAGIYYLLTSLYTYLTTLSKWSVVFVLLDADACNESGRPLVWQVLCKLLSEDKVNTVNILPILHCCMSLIGGYYDKIWYEQIIEYIFALTQYITKQKDTPSPSSDMQGLETLPSYDQCWLKCIYALNCFIMGTTAVRDDASEFAIDRLQRCLLRRGMSIPSSVALYTCFSEVMYKLLKDYGSTERRKSFIVGVFVNSLLSSSELLVKYPLFCDFWLKVVDYLCYLINGRGSIHEMTVERVKNLLLVMIMEKRFDEMSAIAGRDMLEASLIALDSYCPTMREDLKKAISSSQDMHGKEAESEAEGEAEGEAGAVIIVRDNEEGNGDSGIEVDGKGVEGEIDAVVITNKDEESLVHS